MLARILIILRSFDPNYFKAKKNNLKVMNPVLTVACVLYIINFLYCKNESIKSISKENLGGERQETPNIFAMLTCDTESLVPRKGKPVKMAHGVKSQLTLVTLHICRFRSLKNDSCRLTIDMENKNKNQWYIAQHCFPIIFALALKFNFFFFFFFFFFFIETGS